MFLILNEPPLVIGMEIAEALRKKGLRGITAENLEQANSAIDHGPAIDLLIIENFCLLSSTTELEALASRIRTKVPNVKIFIRGRQTVKGSEGAEGLRKFMETL